MLDTFFTNTYHWYGCSECQRYYALTSHDIAYDEERHCPEGHSMRDGRMLSKQWQELTCLWGLFTALYFEQEKPKPWISFAQMELADQFQRALKEKSKGVSNGNH